VDRREDSTPPTFNDDWSDTLPGAEAALAGTRWNLVSASISALVVGSIALLAVNTMPAVTTVGIENANHGFLPYRLFRELTETDSGALLAKPAKPTPLDRALAAEQEQRQPAVETHTVTLDTGDTLAGVLENAGVSPEDANAAILALAGVFNPRNLRAGQSFELTYNTQPDPASSALSNTSSDDDSSGDLSRAQPEAGEPITRLLSIRFSPSVDHDITVARAADGSFAANDVVKRLVPHIHRAGTTIDSSLYLSAMRVGIPAEVVRQMMQMFSYKVDFQRDIHPGDSFEVFYDYYYTPEGQPAKQGNIRYAVMRLGGRQIALYRYQPDPNAPADYFDAGGQSAKGMLMKTPVDGARLTSGFGMRFHPILGYTRMHKGVDFGVPIGTPVMAAGAGTVAFVGWENGYGRFVIVNHGNGYSTGYGHLSRFAPGLHKGSRVSQAQVIAYSGMTGMATGPHLHYEIRIGGKQVNPLTVKVASGRKLAGKDLREFQAARLHVDDELASTRLETRVADASAALRQGN